MPAIRARQQDKSVPTLLGELWELVVAYAKQETIEPIKGLRRFLVFGLGGGALLAIGLPVLAVAGLRALQTETVVGRWSWAPYLVVFFGVVLVAVLAASRIKGGRA